MTTVEKVEQLLARARRIHAAVKEWRGSGATWDYISPDGVRKKYTVVGLKPTEHLQDDIEALFVWAWAMKDYLKRLTQALGKDPKLIEELVDRTPALCLVADLANKIKHGEAKRAPRTPYDPRLGDTTYRFKKPERVTYTAESITLTPGAEGGEVSLPVLDSSGKDIGDAIEILTDAIGHWERELAALVAENGDGIG